MKKMTKLLAVVMALAMLLCMVPVSVSALNEPNELYVGEQDHVKDNLIELLREKGPKIKVESVREENSFYEITHEDGVGYVLTFYNAYPMSGVLSKKCGLYCDGDLTVRLDVTDDFFARSGGKNASVTFDLNDTYEDPKNPGTYIDTTGANGWVVEGTLTIECVNKISDKAVLYVDGSFASGNRGSTGIKAQAVLLNNVEVNVNGGNIGVDAENTIAMIDSSLNVNLNRALLNKDSTGAHDKYIFTYSIRTENLLEARSTISENGKISLKAYWGSGEDGRNAQDRNDNRGMEYDPHAYVYQYGFLVDRDEMTDEKSISLRWRQGFKMFYNIAMIPDCVHLENPEGEDTHRISGKSYTFNWISISGDRASIRRPTPAGGVFLVQNLVCGKATYKMDECRVTGTLKWWQVVPYWLSFEWNK